MPECRRAASVCIKCEWLFVYIYGSFRCLVPVLFNLLFYDYECVFSAVSFRVKASWLDCVTAGFLFYIHRVRVVNYTVF